MNTLISLWLPILLSAIAVFVISSLVHMLIKWHNSDFKQVPNEDAVRAAIRAGNPTPGCYVFPYCQGMKDMGSEVMKQKYTEGPIGHLTILPNGMPNMGKYLGLWFLFCVLVSATVAYVVGHIFPLNASTARGAAKLAFALSFLAYGFGNFQLSIWGGRPWSATIKHLVDAALYAAGTGAVFCYLWK